MSTPEPVEYPEAWRPSWAPPFPEPAEPDSKLQPLEVELHIAALSDQEFADLTRRARGGRN